jgi:hypothetical protein
MTKRSFSDVNVWFALAVADPSAASRGPGLVGCGVLARRLFPPDSARAGAAAVADDGLGGQPLTKEEAWHVFDGFLSDSRVRVFPEPPPIEDLFRSFSSLRRASPKLGVDAYLAARAAASNATLVTFHKAFSQYPVETLILEAE